MAAKKKIISEMNYKYRYDLELNIPLIRIHAFHINLPESLLEDSSEEEEFIIDSNSNIVEELLHVLGLGGGLGVAGIVALVRILPPFDIVVGRIPLVPFLTHLNIPPMSI